jgi:hypothetical protein
LHIIVDTALGGSQKGKWCQHPSQSQRCLAIVAVKLQENLHTPGFLIPKWEVLRASGISTSCKGTPSSLSPFFTSSMEEANLNKEKWLLEWLKW